MIYSPLEIIQLAEAHPDHTVVFFAVGFETTTPPTVAMLDECIKRRIRNVAIFCNHVLTPPAIKSILELNIDEPEYHLDGLIGPGHVSLITGTDAYHELCEHYQTPIVVSGFEPTDLLQSIMMLIDQVNAHEYQLENQYLRAANSDGNIKAQKLIQSYLEVRDEFEWRGLGLLNSSAVKLKSEYRDFDAELLFRDVDTTPVIYKACKCPEVLTGRVSPVACPLFDNPCTPDNPLGSCMVSSEGACAAYYHYQRNTRVLR